MENASKALLMAGGVLIAIIIISLLVRTYGSIGNFQMQQLSAEETEKLEAFNKEYTKYLNQYVYGTEVITVVNKAINYKVNKGILIEVFIDNVQVRRIEQLDFDEIKSKPFKCTDIDYGSDGKVNKICFESKNITDSEL